MREFSGRRSAFQSACGTRARIIGTIRLMELRHLRYFIAAAEEEHFGRASDRLYVTRPAVSQIIADLENELGTLLFERLAHRVKLTQAGHALLPRLRAVMSELDESLTVAKRVGEGKSGALKIGYGSLTLMHSLFRDAIKQFSEMYPDVALTLCEMPSAEQPKALAAGKIQAGFMHFGPKPLALRQVRGKGDLGGSALDWFELQTGGLGVVVPRDHRLAKRKSVSLADLAQEHFVVVPRSSSSPGVGPLYSFCQKAGFEPNIVQEVSTITSQLNLISVGMGIGLAVTGPRFSYPSNLAIVALDGVNYKTSFVFGWIKGQKDSILDRMLQTIKGLVKTS